MDQVNRLELYMRKNPDQNEPNNRRTPRDNRPLIEVSRTTPIENIALKPETPEKPDDFSESSWQIIVAATEFVNQIELRTLDELIYRYLKTIVSAERCVCHQCRLLVISLSEQLDKELFRQRKSFASEQQYLHDMEPDQTKKIAEQQKILAEIEEGMADLYSNKLAEIIEKVDAITESPEVIELERRAKRLQKYLDKATKDPETHLKEGLTPNERKIVQKLLREARERRKEASQRRAAIQEKKNSK